MHVEAVNPSGWSAPRGYNNGVVVEGAQRLVFVAGQIAWDEGQRLVGGDDFVAQFRRALENVVAVVAAAGGAPDALVSLTVYVTDKRRYREHLADVGQAWRAVVGKHFPAMALVEVAALLEEGALVEIQGVAALGAVRDGG